MKMKWNQHSLFILILALAATSCSLRIRGAVSPSTSSEVTPSVPVLPAIKLNSGVNALLSLPGGTKIAAGAFTSYNPEKAPRFVTLNSDGTVDSSMTMVSTGFDKTVKVMISELDTSGTATGKFLVGGTFTRYNGAPVYSYARLNSDGSIDNTFGGTLSTAMEATNVIVQELSNVTGLPTGKILLGGDFQSVHGVAAPNGIVRLNSDGTLDATFNGAGSGTDGGIRVIELERSDITGLPTGKIICMGTFWNYNGADVPDGLIRLNSDGSIDATFNPGGLGLGTMPQYPSLSLEYAVTGLPTGKFLVGTQGGNYNGASVGLRSVVRINSNGTFDATYDSTAANFDSVLSIVPELDTLGVPTGKALVGGSKFFGTYYDQLLRLNSDGSIDATFNFGNAGFSTHIGPFAIDGATDGTGERLFMGVKAILQERSNTGAITGKIYVGGAFYKYNGVEGSHNFLRLNADGTLDNTYTPNSGVGFADAVFSFSRSYTGSLPDGKIIITGSFVGFGGTSVSRRLVKLTSSGALDTTFSAAGTGFNAEVADVIAERNLAGALTGKYIAVGVFTEYSGTPVGKIARINSDGSLDLTFNSGLGFDNGFSKKIKQELDNTGALTGKLLVAHRGSTYNGVAAPSGILRLNSDGSLDNTFNGAGAGANGYGANDFVQELNPATGLPTGNILIVGLFTSYNGDASVPDSFARLTSTGAYDASFNGGNAGLNSYATSITNEYAPSGLPTGNLIVATVAGTYNGAGINGGLARFTSAGVLDGSFSSGGSGFTEAPLGPSVVNTVIVERNTSGTPTGKLLVGGRFTGYGGVSVPDRLLRLNSDGTWDSTFNTGETGWHGNVTAITQELNALTSLPTGNVLIGGWFSGYNSSNVVQGIGRIDSNGAIQ